ncbi:hypothetical protein BD311DRAFT_68541 [Dichomitus squalens]|uniref:Uncharacterized protein n=1 Tax=Dichomitus squalens TaxID=114155 RepID=A0A4Q9M9B0_9APHY|nr:hypothetical protein BD311DRAFT_68541 [Dichomitus squalens]
MTDDEQLLVGIIARQLRLERQETLAVQVHHSSDLWMIHDQYPDGEGGHSGRSVHLASQQLEPELVARYIRRFTSLYIPHCDDYISGHYLSPGGEVVSFLRAILAFSVSWLFHCPF